MNTLEKLLEKHGGPVVHLEEIAQEYLGLGPRKAAVLAAQGELPLPAFKLGTRKSPWLVNIEDLARLIRERSKEARESWTD